MFDFALDPNLPKAEFYRQLNSAADALTSGEPDAIANMANVAALLWHTLPDCNWTGFYRVVAGELVLGPFCGLPACIRIAFGQGVCGTAAALGESQLVRDVHAFPGHIACDAASRSELVVPVLRAGPGGERQVVAVIDCDSPDLARFDEEDRTGLEELARIIAPRI